MKISLLVIGKTDEKYLQEGISIYLKRLEHYINFEYIEIPALKKTAGLNPDRVKQKEAELINKHLDKADCLILLDEKGKTYGSVEFANFLQQRMNAGIRHVIFVVGGAWGFAPELLARANYKVSLSAMTFSHQMVRLFFTEQLYRAFSILKGESYHNE